MHSVSLGHLPGSRSVSAHRNPSACDCCSCRCLQHSRLNRPRDPRTLPKDAAKKMNSQEFGFPRLPQQGQSSQLQLFCHRLCSKTLLWCWRHNRRPIYRDGRDGRPGGHRLACSQFRGLEWTGVARARPLVAPAGRWAAPECRLSVPRRWAFPDSAGTCQAPLGAMGLPPMACGGERRGGGRALRRPAAGLQAMCRRAAQLPRAAPRPAHEQAPALQPMSWTLRWLVRSQCAPLSRPRPPAL